MKIKAMTRKEWVQKHNPYAINDTSLGGVFGCPKDSGFDNQICAKSEYASNFTCLICWNLPAKRNGKYIMLCKGAGNAKRRLHY